MGGAGVSFLELEAMEDEIPRRDAKTLRSAQRSKNRVEMRRVSRAPRHHAARILLIESACLPI